MEERLLRTAQCFSFIDPEYYIMAPLNGLQMACRDAVLHRSRGFQGMWPSEHSAFRPSSSELVQALTSASDVRSEKSCA